MTLVLAALVLLEASWTCAVPGEVKHGYLGPTANPATATNDSMPSDRSGIAWYRKSVNGKVSIALYRDTGM